MTMKTMAGLLACALLILGGNAWGNSTPVYLTGIQGTDIIPIRNHQIRMAREVVNIDCKWWEYSVQVDFWFKNTTRQEQEITLGFPVDYSPPMEEVDIENLKNSLKSFKVGWKGMPASFTVGKPQHIEYRDKNKVLYSFCRQWITWRARFGPGEEVHSRVGYTFPCWTKDNEDNDGFVYLKYILKTGAAWQGPIESSIIKIHYGHPLHYCGIPVEDEKLPDLSTLKIHPKGYVVDEKKRTVTWEFKNFVPDKDIYFGWGGVPDFKELDEEQKILFENAPAMTEKSGGK